MYFPAFYTSLSLRLSIILDSKGVSKDIVDKRRQLYLKAEALRFVGNRLINKINTRIPVPHRTRIDNIYHFGSLIEGSTTPGLNSDLDILHEYISFANVLQEECDFQPDVMNVFMKQGPDTPYGHCILLIVTLWNSPTYRFYFDNEGHEYLPNEFLINVLRSFRNDYDYSFMHGPSVYYKDMDSIAAFKCMSWPKEYLQDLLRFRSYNWPSPRLVDLIKETGFFLVPIGHSESDLSFLEWRISLSLAERMLIFNLNITQLHCLVLLKMLKTTYFEPLVGDGFSSYHCKTVLFYTLSRTPPFLWKRDKLFVCLHMCLITLKTFLQRKFCPQFFNPKLNLFTGKLTTQNCKSLFRLITNFLNEDLKCLLGIQVDKVGDSLLSLHVPINSSLETHNRILIHIFENIARQLQEWTVILFSREMQHFSRNKSISITFELVKELLHIMKYGNETEHGAARLLIGPNCAYLASLLSACRVNKKQKITEDLINLFHIGFQTDAASTRLKLVSALYCNAQYEKALQIVEETHIMLESNPLPVCCFFIQAYPFPWPKFYNAASELLNDGRSRNAFAACVRYTKQEIWICPLGMRRLVLNASKKTTYSNQKHHGAEIDAKAFLFYLQFLLYRTLDRDGLKTNALNKLIKCVNSNPVEWKDTFFDFISRDQSTMIGKYASLLFWYPDKEMHNYHSAVAPETELRLSTSPFGPAGLSVCYAFRKCSSVQHMDMALNLLGYSFEMENNNAIALAFYWMSFLIQPSNVLERHILRVQLPEYRNWYCYRFLMFRMNGSQKAITELLSVPELCLSFVNMLQACRTKQQSPNRNAEEILRLEALLCAFVSVMLPVCYRQKKGLILSSMYERLPPLLLIESKKFDIRQNEKNTLESLIAKYWRLRSNGRLVIPASVLRQQMLFY